MYFKSQSTVQYHTVLDAKVHKYIIIDVHISTLIKMKKIAHSRDTKTTPTH